MSAEMQEPETADAAETDEREELAWVKLCPEIKLGYSGIERIIYSGDPTEVQNGSDYGVVLRDPTVIEGTLYKNREMGGFEFARDAKRDGDAQKSSDYFVANPDGDERTSEDTLDDKVIGISDGAKDLPATPVEDNQFAEDKVLVWVGGLSGQFLSRDLDFNGSPTAKYNDDGYLVKGLHQFPEEWWDASSSRKREMVRDEGLAPRAARYPVLREDVQDAEGFIVTSRGNGDAHYIDVYFNDFDEEEGETWEDATKVEPTYNEPEAIEILSERGIEMNLVHEEGWQDKPDTAHGHVSSAGSFDIDLGDDDSDGALATEARLFADELASALADRGMTLDDVQEGWVYTQASKPSNAGRLGIDPTADADETDLPVDEMEQYIGTQLGS